MENLRIILAGIGILVIGAMFLYGYAASRKRKNVVPRTAFDPVSDLSVSAQSDDPQDIDSDLAELSGLVAESRVASPSADGVETIAGESFSTAAAAASAIANDEIPPMTNDAALEIEALDQSSYIIALNIVVNSGTEFAGTDIASVFAEIGICYGDMQIFHYCGDQAMESDHPVYSIAHMLEPGIFPSENLDSFSTTGLVVFMRLPGPIDGRVAFELMLRHAQRITVSLDGELRNEGHELLDESGIDQIRQRISRFSHSSLPA